MNKDMPTVVLPDLIDTAEMLKLMQLLRNANRIVVTAHHGPDGDAVGSCLGWAAYLRTLGKDVHVIFPSWYPDFLRWIPGSKDTLIYRDKAEHCRTLLREADLICGLDFNALSRLNLMQEAVEASKAPRMLIDHHVGPEGDFAFILSRPAMSSTSEMVFRLIYQLGGYDQMSRSTAACLYTGIMTDTGNFSYSSSSPELYLAVSLLMRKNVDKESIYKKVYHSWKMGKFTLWNDILSNNLSFYCDARASIFTLSREEMKAHRFIRGDAEGLVNEPLKVRGMKLSVSLREDTEEDVIRVSLRSTDGFHCREMAERFFNGGGHDDAAGGKLPFPLSDAVKTAEQAIAAYDAELRQ